ncbi:MAG: FecR domain-containing protein [Bacteroidota bacterium]
MLQKWIQYWKNSGEKPNESDLSQAEIDQLEKIWRAADPPESELEVDVDAAWASVEDKLFGQSVDAKPTPLRTVYSRRLYWVAAVLTGLAIGTWWLLNADQTTETEWATVLNEGRAPRQIKLPDGSQVWLNTNSELAYAQPFEPRQTRLKGEAFFEVERNPLQPFTVQTGEVETRVLGTSFNIRAYANQQVEVSVSTGKVAVAAQNQKVELTPGQVVNYSAQNQKLEQVESIESEPSIWLEESISLGNGQPLSEATAVLTNYFGRAFVFEEASLVDCPLEPGEEVVASRTSGLEEALAELNFFLDDGLQFRIEKDTVFIAGSCVSQ